MNDSIEINIFQTFADIDPMQWRKIEAASFPFQDYQFLWALEKTNCLGERTGWFPKIYTAWRDLELSAAMVVYEKNNSYGEYIFDWEWARAYSQNGLAYYPKWVLAVPFTPATGPKILGQDQEAKRALLERVLADYESSLASSMHALFIPNAELDAWRAVGFEERHSLQYHWQNSGFDSFAAYLAVLTGKRRRQVERERRQIPSDVEVTVRSGTEIREEDADSFYEFYESTIDKKGAIPYLTPGFFRQIFAEMSNRILLVSARRHGKAIAAAINFFKGTTIFGRYWGCSEEARNLHFELCYYRVIEFAIAQGLQTFEAGAQGPHKLQRGFDATLTLSAHKIKHPVFSQAIGRYIVEERQHVEAALADARVHSARRKPG